jgi:hypothetical protein
VDAKKSGLGTDRRFDEFAAGETVLTDEQLSGQQGMVFAEVDGNSDGEVTREEWLSWHEQRFTAATQSGETGMPIADYQSMDWASSKGYVRPMSGIRAKQGMTDTRHALSTRLSRCAKAARSGRRGYHSV